MTFSRAVIFGLAIAAMISVSSPVLAQKKPTEPIKVYVYTTLDESGFVDPAQKQRLDSVEDLKKALPKKDLIVLVSDKDAADVTLEVLARGSKETGSSTTTTTKGYYGVWNTTTDNDTAKVVGVGLRAGTYTSLIQGVDDNNYIQYWKRAAGDAAEKIQRWIKANHDRLITLRKN